MILALSEAGKAFIIEAGHQPVQATLDEVTADLNRLIPVGQPNQNMSDALISLAYSIREGAQDVDGKDTLEGSLMTVGMNLALFDEVSKGFVGWRFRRGVEDEDMLAWRRAEAALFNSPVAIEPPT